jgi:hypothetical protein
MKRDVGLLPLLWELKRYGPHTKGFKVRNSDTDEDRRAHLWAALWTHDARALPIYTMQWQAPCKIGACLWCDILGFHFCGTSVYPSATCHLPRNHATRAAATAAMFDAPDFLSGLGARKKPKATKHRDQRAAQATAAARVIAGESTKVCYG